jgi:hypothetical protein
MTKAKSKFTRHNTDKLGGKSFARRGNRLGMNTKPLTQMKGRSVKSELLTDGGSKIVTRAIVKPKTKGRARRKMASDSHWNKDGIGLTAMHNTRAHEQPDVMGGPGVARNLLQTSEAANKGDSFVEAGAGIHMRRPGKTGTYDVEITSHLDPSGRRTQKDMVLQRRGSMTAFEGTIKSPLG